ncbi:hypothetical protein [Microbacterium resistens]|uniref:hypothetical protein n=1 Tax=Microbacterium resistens TaxID=156977 RepID=UPI00366CB467
MSAAAPSARVPARTWSRALLRLSPALMVALVYLAARVLTTGMLAVAAGLSGPGSRFGPDAGIGSFVLAWDAQWYWWVAENGYPSELPLTEGGQVAENAWAFMPLYPMLAKLVGFPLGSWGAGALVVSLVAGYLACLVLYRILAGKVGRRAAMWSVALCAAGPLGALFQVGYAEALFLLFLLLGIDGLIRRRYVRLYALIPLMGFTRPGVLAFALLLGLVLVLRWVRRKDDPLYTREFVHILALGALATVVGFSWQFIAGIVTGDPGAYLATELAWRRNWVEGGAAGFFPFEGWVTAAPLWFGIWGLPGWLGLVVLVLLVAGAALLLLRDPRVRRLGPVIRLWSASYLLYLLAVFFPQSSTLRLLFPLTPLWGALAVGRSRGVRIGAVVVGLVLQWAWIYNVYALGDTFWRVP